MKPERIFYGTKQTSWIDSTSTFEEFAAFCGKCRHFKVVGNLNASQQVVSIDEEYYVQDLVKKEFSRLNLIGCFGVSADNIQKEQLMKENVRFAYDFEVVSVSNGRKKHYFFKIQSMCVRH